LMRSNEIVILPKPKEGQEHVSYTQISTGLVIT
jgi:hypothetical protein